MGRFGPLGGLRMTRGSPDPESVAGAQGAGPGSRQEVAAHYLEYAAQIRDLASGEPDLVLRNRLTALAERYESLARRFEADRNLP